jgi:two-component system alkaline phosphatase synthesis response regulator PhoP
MAKTILIIDDDEMVRAMVTRYLERSNYRVVTASTGENGIESYRSEKPDLVVLDIAMPEMSGFEVASSIRAIQRGENRPHTPIVILTAYARSFFLSTGSETGIDSYLTKPISPEQLVSHIQQFLGSSEE